MSSHSLVAMELFLAPPPLVPLHGSFYANSYEKERERERLSLSKMFHVFRYVGCLAKVGHRLSLSLSLSLFSSVNSSVLPFIISAILVLPCRSSPSSSLSWLVVLSSASVAIATASSGVSSRVKNVSHTVTDLWNSVGCITFPSPASHHRRQTLPLDFPLLTVSGIVFSAILLSLNSRFVHSPLARHAIHVQTLISFRSRQICFSRFLFDTFKEEPDTSTSERTEDSLLSVRIRTLSSHFQAREQINFSLARLFLIDCISLKLITLS
jgi:hypothetical protein